MNLFFVGDWSPVSSQDYGFGDLLAVGNLECAFADDAVTSGKAYVSILPWKCLDNVVAAGFAAVSIANNHAYDAGVTGFDSLVAELRKRGIRYFGTREKPFVQLEDGVNKVAVIGCLEPCGSRGPRIFRQEDVATLVRCIRRDFDFVFIYPHWGMEGEYTRYPSPKQRRLARRWIDIGADGVFGSHSHVFQGRETYNNKPIYYSLGNFEFDHTESRLYPGTDLGLVVEVDGNGRVREHVKPKNDPLRHMVEEERQLVEVISSPLKDWTTWKWAKAIGPFNLKKNTASWRIRLKRNFIKTFPKYLIWQILPKTLLFRAASIATFFSRKRNT